MPKIITQILVFIVLLMINLPLAYSQSADENTIDDLNFKFTIKLPSEWETKDKKETGDKDGISYSFERKDKKMAIMLLAFKLSSVKNIDDFIYNLEKDISLNIPPKNGEYVEKDSVRYDMKSADYKDNKFAESIFYFRTKLPDASNNYVYMVRFIMNSIDSNSDTESHINNIISTFKPTAE
jgi:hypothetical protein